MDDTGASLEVSKAANVTRKRRSSILKNQRPPRTPFSELEFNVATPTDTAKSRRVSFSRRTGVAEFVTNEATTTWKNFYEEHNKSLETSGNEPAAPRQVIEHIGKRIFDQQFEEIEVVDIGGTLQSNTAGCQNNVNLTLDSTNKLTGPVQNFELSLMTDPQTKVFGDELSVPTMNEMSNPININFSNLNTIGDKCDDLEEIQRDLERSKNVVCQGPFGGRDMSEYIEIDLNMTHIVGKDDGCDMSITEPIPSPKVQAVAKTDSFVIDKKTNEDWTVDKENIVINPYVTPKESLNFASNDADDKILVFDGKKLTVQSERQSLPDLDEKNKYHNLLPDATETTPQRKTIFLNINDDLPNFVQDSVPSTDNKDNRLQATMYNDCDLSITQGVINNIDVKKTNEKRKTIVFDEGADVSITQAVPSKVIINKQKRHTIIYENDNENNISITQTVPTNIINKNKRKTIVYEDDNISFTQAIPANLIMDDKKTVQDKTLLYQNDDDISMTQGVPDNIIRNNQVNDDDISMTRAISSNIIINTKTIYDDSNINETVAVNNIIEVNESDKQRTVYENNISFTQAIPDVMLDEVQNKTESTKTKRITIYDNDISMTQAMPSNIIQTLVKSENINLVNNEEKLTKPNNNVIGKSINKLTEIKVETLLDSYNGNVSNLSMTKPIPSNIIDLQSEILKKNDKSEINQNENSLIEGDTPDVLVYQANQTITIDKYKDIDEKENQDIIDDNNIGLGKSECIDEGSCKPDVNYSEIKVELIKEQGNPAEVDVINKSIVKRESFIVTKKSDHLPKGNIKKSILNELLDMSCASFEDEIDNETKTSPLKSTNEMKVSFKTDSIDMWQDEKVSKNSDNIECCENNKLIVKGEISDENESISQIVAKPQAIDYKEDSEDVHHLQNQIDNLNDEIQQKKVSTNRHYETIISSDLQKSLDKLNSSVNNEKKSINENKSFKNADDTNELLEMLSDFTDGRTVEPEKPVPIEIKGHLAIENKIEPKRLNFAPNRLSMVLSREDLLNNISMAQAALQQSRFEIDDESLEDTMDSSEEVTEMESPRKSIRMSNEVVKTLQFEEDESINDTSFDYDAKVSPLKKTAFGETSYMKESKAKVIPTYLKDVSDNIKALMTDLVKPVNATPFETSNLDKSLRKPPSTASTQIQANLLTSSQIDMDTELLSNADSMHDAKPSEISTAEIASIGNKAIAEALRQSLEPILANASIETDVEKIAEIKKPIRKSINGPVLVFDHTNPLNNVLLSQPDFTKVHRYNPIPSTETMTSEYESSTQVTDKVEQYEVERVSKCYNVESKNQSALQSGDTCPDIMNTNSIISNISKPISIDRSTEGIVLDVKDREVNTLIVMKETKEILETNSSLTLVDDALARSVFDVDIKTSSEDADDRRSPVRVIYKMEQEPDSLQKMDSDFTSIDDLEADENSKPKKRIYSPTKRDKHTTSAPAEVTPKPVSKMQKMSISPQTNEAVSPEKKEVKKSPKHKIGPDKLKSKTLTVQQLLTKHAVENYKDKTLTKKILEAMDASSIFDVDTISQIICGPNGSDAVPSYTSNTLSRDTRELSIVDSRATSAVGSDMSKTTWRPESVNEQSSKNLIEECSSGANVVAKIDTLPFMGTRDCEWESSTGDVWIFRLLRSRVRVVFRLAHAHHNASGSRVRADTPVLSLAVEPVTYEERDPLARLAVRLAVRAMRHSARCSSAGSACAVLSRCAALARRALRWARALRDARARLALAITDEGDVALKVANIPLRSVWEVRLRIELVEEEGEEAWPRVSEARAVAVLADGGAAPALDRLVRPLTSDWGHVPAAIWKIFKYLKNKTRDDDLFGL